MPGNSFSFVKKSPIVARFVAVIFFFSGLSALIYQIVWQRLLTIYYGVGPISIAVVVTVYMAGLGLGALLGGYASERLRNRVFFYCLVELCIGLFGFASPGFLKFLGDHTAGASYALTFIYSFVFLFAPTFLMGITLPLLTKIFSGVVNNFFEVVSFLYFVNTMGAAVGAIVASYIIISFFGMLVAIHVAAAINIGIAALILALLGSAPLPSAPRAGPEGCFGCDASLGPLVYPIAVITGFVAIGFEIIWFRVIGQLAKDSPYAFSSTLAVYLVGIAVGSFATKRILLWRPWLDKKSLFFSMQFLIGATIALSFAGFYFLTKDTVFGALVRTSFVMDVHPAWDVVRGAGLGELSRRLFLLFDVFVWSALFVLIPSLLMGASFPLIATLAPDKDRRQGKAVGLVYFFVVVGNALGGLLTGLVIVPSFKTESTVAAFCAVGIVFGLGVGKIGANRALPLTARAGVVVAVLTGIAVLFPHNGDLYEAIYQSVFAKRENLLFDEGIDGLIATYHDGDRVITFINGSAHGGRPGYPFYYETIEAMSRTPDLTKALVIGFGDGSTVEMILKSAEVRELVLVELNATLIANLRRLPVLNRILSDPRLHLIIDDGRRFLINSRERFDLITTDPLRTTTAYSNNLYADSFFRLIAAHLTQGGVYLAWRDEHRVVPKTLASVFPFLEMHSFFCISSNNPLTVYDGRRQQLLGLFSDNERRLVLARAEYLGDRGAVLKMTRSYPINQDLQPWTEYFLGLHTLETAGWLADTH
jgi:predicted membrane-bound spermidine synthase